MTQFKQGWYIIYVRPMKEKSISFYLDQKKVEFFLPLMKQQRQWHDRKKTILTPLFPGYIFVKLTNMTDYFNSINIEGVIRFLKSENSPVLISQSVIDQVTLLVNNGTGLDVTESFFEKGSRILVEEGALAGISGEVVQHNGANRILVRLSVLNKNLLVNIPTEIASLLPDTASLQLA